MLSPVLPLKQKNLITMQRYILFILIILNLFPFTLKAEEGMWPSVLLSKKIAEMHKMGLKLSAEEIFSTTNASIKDAIVQFGGGCTGVLVSDQGLLLTNHHCGFGSIQRQSSLDHDYLSTGFWAGSLQEELANPGLSVTFLVSMEDVSARVLEGVSPDISEQERGAIIKKISGRSKRKRHKPADMMQKSSHSTQVTSISCFLMKYLRTYDS